MKANKITISPGNMKTGRIPSISLNKSTCRKDAPCFKECYMNKRLAMWKNVGASYDKNTTILNNDSTYWLQISNYLTKHKPKFFRYHVHGDIPNKSYLKEMLNIAVSFPDTRFLCFTKKYNLVLSEHSVKNLSIVFSSWPGYPMPKQSRFPIAFMQDGTETRVKNALECPGNCETCGVCWELKSIKKNVVFNKH